MASLKQRVESFLSGRLGFMLALFTPSLLLISFTFLVPVLYALYLSLYKYNPLFGSSEFLGLGNYLRIFSSGVFWNSLTVTVYFAFAAVLVEVLLGLLIALLLNRSFWGNSVLRAALILPWAVPWVINGIMWKWIYNPKFGALNGLLKQLGLISSYKVWLGDPFTAINMVVLADVWKETPFIALLLLAGLQTIPEHLYEAALTEGAGAWSQFWTITLPMLKPFLAIAVILRGIWAFKTFDLIYSLTQGGPSQSTNVLNFYIYTTSFSRLNFGYGSALSVLFTLLILVLCWLYFRAAYRTRSGLEGG